MSPNHHPGEDLLLDYAGGAASQGVALIVATHLAFCAQCRDAVAFSEGLGGALLEDVAPAAVSAAARAAVLGKLDDFSSVARPDGKPLLTDGSSHFSWPTLPRSQDGTPSPLRAFLGRDLSQVSWRHLGPRLAYLPLRRRHGTAIRLLKGAPGTDTGRHGHQGLEYTLVLSGGFMDETGAYGPGDLQIATPALTHNPVADPGEDCINLSVTTGALCFEGLAQKIAARLFGF